MRALIESAAYRIAVKLKEANPEETASIEVMKYALIGVLHNALTLGTAFLVGLCLGQLTETILAAFAFILLRLISAGYHFKSALSCFLVSSVIFISIPLIPLSSDWLAYINSVSLLLVLVFAPSRVKEHIRISPKRHPLLKWISASLVAAAYLIPNPVIILAFLAQAVTLVHFRSEGVSK